MNQTWFEMPETRRRNYKNSVWIPLRAAQCLEKIGTYGYAGFKEEFFGCGTLAIPLDKKHLAEKFGWDEIGLSPSHGSYIDADEYIPADIYVDYKAEFRGVYLVLEQSENGDDHTDWHLNQDFLFALRLKREGDVWVRPSEGYIEVVRLKRTDDGIPALIEVRAEHLRDYLCARKMVLRITSYRSRRVISEDKLGITWKEDFISETTKTDRWEGRISEIHEGGHPFGSQVAVFHASRTDIDPTEDVPVMGLPNDDNIASSSTTHGFTGRKLCFIQGELWRNEWFEPSDKSPRIKRDQVPATVFFITDANGTRENKDTLRSGGRWLWFNPAVINSLLQRRNSVLEWYTAETGEVGAAAGKTVHFGVNQLGLVNVYAKDIALLDDWHQQIWAGENVSPDGGVSTELQDSQVRAAPADTQAPEALLAQALEHLNELSQEKIGIKLIREHDFIPELLRKCHRFRAIDKAGLLALAKDVARLTADSIDAAAIQTLVTPPKGEKWGSLKSLENLIARKIDPQKARKMMGALAGIYDLRLNDAHLPTSQFDDACKLIGLDVSKPYVIQGHKLLHACVTSLYDIISVLERWDSSSSEKGDAI